MKRRDFLRHSIISLGTLLGTQFPSLSPLAHAQDTNGGETLELEGAIRNVHDPVIIKHEDYYYLFCTGVGISMRRSRDLEVWRVAPGGSVFQSLPEETFAYVQGADNIWAPDISYYNNKYHVYYSVSTFGSNRSAIGLVTNATLNRDDDDFEWIDEGIVVKSDYSDNYNAIDANLILDTDEIPWLVFGSHWGGIKMIRLDYETGKQSTEDDTLYSVASRAVHPRAVEAPFIVHNAGYYYLFVSFDQCCQGINSTYNVRVGRSEEITGPYVDREGVDMMADGGTQITFSSRRYRGPGHNAILRDGDKDYIVYHAYDAVQGGTPTLRIDSIIWEEDGFPSVVGMQAEE